MSDGYKDTLITRIVNEENKPEGLVFLRTFTYKQKPPKYRAEVGGDNVFYFEDGTIIERENYVQECDICKKKAKTREYRQAREHHDQWYDVKRDLCDSCIVDELFRCNKTLLDYTLLNKT